MFQYETVEQAVATRQALHGKKWPASNPKVLGVEFRNMEEVIYSAFCLLIISRVFRMHSTHFHAIKWNNHTFFKTGNAYHYAFSSTWVCV